MKAITYQKDQDTFTYTDIDTPALASGLDVLVKVHAVGLNPVDAKVNLWHEMVDGMDDTFVGGLDVSGEIVAIGDKVSGWQVGDRVLYHGNMRRRMNGGFAEYAIQDSRTLVAHPEDVREQIMAITEGLGVEVSLDCVGGDNEILCASVLGFEGEMVELVRTTRATEYPGAFLQGLTFHQLSLGSGHVHGEKGFASIVNAGVEFSHMLERGEVMVPKLEVVALKDVAQALVSIRQQRTVGKIVAKLVD